jgi:tRNA 2-thiouridine synthesizing protein E
VIGYVQDQYQHEVVLTIRKVGKSGVVDIKEFYSLFRAGH